MTVFVADIGSPRLGNLGWAYIDQTVRVSGDNIDEGLGFARRALETGPLMLGLEAPLFVPLRDDIMLATKARGGEERRPWSAGAGAQVLAMNLPIMTYIFKALFSAVKGSTCHLNPDDGFTHTPKQCLIFEALVSGPDKGNSHEEDAMVMAAYCYKFAQEKTVPPSIYREEDRVEFLNLAAASALHCGWINDINALHSETPIYKPSENPF